MLHSFPGVWVSRQTAGLLTNKSDVVTHHCWYRNMAFSRLLTLLGSKPKTKTGNKFPKAKDLTFKVKAKDTICWPRGLQLSIFHCLTKLKELLELHNLFLYLLPAAAFGAENNASGDTICQHYRCIIWFCNFKNPFVTAACLSMCTSVFSAHTLWHFRCITLIFYIFLRVLTDVLLSPYVPWCTLVSDSLLIHCACCM